MCAGDFTTIRYDPIIADWKHSMAQENRLFIYKLFLCFLSVSFQVNFPVGCVGRAFKIS